MPKGETSRPLNSAERRALKTLLNLNDEMKNKSRANKLEIMMGDRYGKAAATLKGAKVKQRVRDYMKELGREKGASQAAKQLRYITKNALR